MIVKNSSIFSKKQKRSIIVMSLIIDIIFVVVFIATIIISYKNNISLIHRNYRVLAVLAICGTISCGDIVTIFTKRKSIAFVIIRRLSSQKDIFSQMGIDINSKQLSFCEKILGSSSNKKLIYVYGKKNKGKSTAVLYLLRSLLLNSGSIEELPWADDITFIDCTNNKEEIINFFFRQTNLLERIKKFNNRLIVIDNVECLGSLFVEENISLFSSCKSFFVLIEDTSCSTPMCGEETLIDAMYVCDFNRSILNLSNEIIPYKEIEDYDEMTKTVFFALYFLTLTSSFVRKKAICNALNIRKKDFNKSFKTIQKLRVFISFPYNTEYCYCYRKNVLRGVDNQFHEDIIYNSTLLSFLYSKNLDDEIKWLCLIRCNIEIIKNVSIKERYAFLHKALKNGNYKSLYDELSCKTKENPQKESIFLYEKAHLAFHIGNHKESTNCYMKLIAAQNAMDQKKELMLGIIESSHGNPDKTNMQMVEKMIGDLKATNDFYSICARYWDIHILSERGRFSCHDVSSIRKRIMECSSSSTRLQRSIIHRSFTDEIRFHHILGLDENENLYNSFYAYLSSCGNIKQEYFCNLYIHANHIHYIDLLNAVLTQNTEEQDLMDLVKTAEYYYDKALSSAYGDEKSKRATTVKQIDLKMMYWDFNFEETIQKINLFLLHSRMNNVGVHEAYCETLLMKAHVLDRHNISNEFGVYVSEEKKCEIYRHFRNSIKIFQDFHNDYGIFRLNFMSLLFELLISNLNEADDIIAELKTLTDHNPCYTKEKNIVNVLIEKKDSVSKLFLLSIFRAYPIILQ